MRLPAHNKVTPGIEKSLSLNDSGSSQSESSEKEGGNDEEVDKEKAKQGAEIGARFLNKLV